MIPTPEPIPAAIGPAPGPAPETAPPVASLRGRDIREYPFVFYPVGLNLRGRKVVLIGAADDREAVEKDEALREVGADVTWFRDYNDVRDEDVADAFFVLFTPQEEPPAIRMRALADKHGFLLCCIDQPKHGFVAMQATVKAGPVRIAISTGGIAPRIGKLMKFALEAVLDDTFVRFIDCHNAQKERNKARITTSAERRAAMIAKATGFKFDIAMTYPQWFLDELAGFRPTVLAAPDAVSADHAQDGAADRAGAGAVTVPPQAPGTH